ncbi:MAG: SGNH/GDSL hydrolase family protein [Bryobacteraceae bacterium]
MRTKTKYLLTRISAFAIVFAATAPLMWAQRPSRPNLSRMVVIGDSLSAGFQNFSLFSDGTPGAPRGGQTRGFARLIADQAGVALPLPSISYPGIPPALELVNGQIVRSPLAPGMRIPPFVQPMNMSVPGFTLGDALVHAYPGNPFLNPIDALSTTIFSGNPTPACGPIPTPNLPRVLKLANPALDPATPFVVSQVLCAAALEPSAIIASIGNNDALGTLTFGTPPTPVARFAVQYAAFLGAARSTGAAVVVGNIPDVTTVPFLVPAPVFAQLCGSLPAGAGPNDFAVPDIGAASFNLCVSYQVRSAALIASAREAVQAYNRVIALQARLFGAVVVDVNRVMADIAANGYRVGGRTLTGGPLGGIFSLDAIHPTNTGYAILANEYIREINRALRMNIPAVSVAAVAATDPLVLPLP